MQKLEKKPFINKGELGQGYTILEKIGDGNFAEVNRCVCKQSNRQFAAKFIMKNRVLLPNTGNTGNKSTLLEIEREAHILANLDHENIVKLKEVFYCKEYVVLILDLVTGGELFARVAECERLSEEEASHFVEQILVGVQHMHSLGIVHLDLKPENIMIEDLACRKIKIIDFGLARVFNPKETFQDMAGTPEFCAPEIVNFDPITLATDMWAIGVITYILLTGISPFAGDTQLETFQNILDCIVDYSRDEIRGVTDLAKDFIRKLLLKNPKKRATVDECLKHPWIKPSDDVQEDRRRGSLISRANLNGLRQFIATAPGSVVNTASEIEPINLPDTSSTVLRETMELISPANDTPQSITHVTNSTAIKPLPDKKNNVKRTNEKHQTNKAENTTGTISANPKQQTKNPQVDNSTTVKRSIENQSSNNNFENELNNDVQLQNRLSRTGEHNVGIDTSVADTKFKKFGPNSNQRGSLEATQLNPQTDRKDKNQSFTDDKKSSIEASRSTATTTAPVTTTTKSSSSSATGWRSTLGSNLIGRLGAAFTAATMGSGQSSVTNNQLSHHRHQQEKINTVKKEFPADVKSCNNNELATNSSDKYSGKPKRLPPPGLHFGTVSRAVKELETNELTVENNTTDMDTTTNNVLISQHVYTKSGNKKESKMETRTVPSDQANKNDKRIWNGHAQTPVTRLKPEPKRAHVGRLQEMFEKVAVTHTGRANGVVTHQ